jgi:Arc/MetJ-type ribon-helix-helix transcriptional regulator
LTGGPKRPWYVDVVREESRPSGCPQVSGTGYSTPKLGDQFPSGNPSAEAIHAPHIPLFSQNGQRYVPAKAAFNRSLLHGMVFGMATTKITITLENHQLEEVRALVAAGAAASVSAFVKHAVGVALFDAAGWREMLEDALRQTGGPLMKKERAWADAILSPRGQKRVSGKGKAA